MWCPCVCSRSHTLFLPLSSVLLLGNSLRSCINTVDSDPPDLRCSKQDGGSFFDEAEDVSHTQVIS